MKRDDAPRMQAHALSAIRELVSIVQLPVGWDFREDLHKLRHEVGLAIGQIDEILRQVYERFPEIDDLRDMNPSQFDGLFKDQP